MVKHRFNTPIKEVAVKRSSLEEIKRLYNRLKNNTVTKNSARIVEEELPTPEMILEAARVVLPQFPYEELEGYNENTLPNGNTINITMIQNDFPTMTSTEIKNNIAIVETYYSNNLDYLVLQEIANHPEVYANNNVLRRDFRNEIDTYLCTMGWCIVEGYGFVRSSISYALAGSKAKNIAEDNFPNFGGSNDRRDAFRHTFWNALLAQYYFTLSSKAKRLGFAKLVTDVREDEYKCGTGNDVDASAMDLHNNYIGRKIWDDNTSFRYVFGVPVALDRPNVLQLENYCLDAVATKSCYIVKNHKTNNSFNYTTAEVEQLILTTNSNTIVYFVGTIAPRWTETIVTLDYSDCVGDGDDIYPKVAENNKTTNRPPSDDDDCIRRIYTTNVIDACFVSKDPNYNPYNN